jgi:ATP-dependent Clp protease ATP-binding subunit ClpC
MADRYIQDRFLPDKAIDLIDEAGARLRIKRMTAPPDLREIDERIAVVRGEKEAAIDGQDFERAARLRDDEKKLLSERSEKEEKPGRRAIRGLPPRWRGGDREVLSSATGIPVFKLTEEESGRLLNMEAEIGKRYIGQNDAVKALARSIRRTRAGLKDPKRPRARSSSPAPRVSERPN